MMRAMRFRAMLASVCCISLLAPAGAEAPLAERLPKQSLFYIGWAGRNLPLDGSTFGQLLREPAVGKILSSLYQAARDSTPPPDRPALEHVWALASIVWQHPIALSLIDVGAGQTGPVISAALLIDLGEHKADFDKHLDAVLLAADVPLKEAVVGKTAYRVLSTPAGPVGFGAMGNVFFLTVGAAAPQKLLSVKPPQSLSAAKSFAAAHKVVGGPNEQLAVYLDLTAIRARVETFAPPAGPDATKSEFSRALDALGLGKATALAGTMRIVDKGLYMKTKLFTPVPHRGLLFPLAGAPITEADLAHLPDDALYAATIKLNPSALYAEIRHVIRQFDPKAEQEFLRGVREAEKELGISITRDILANLGDTWTLLSAPSIGGFGTGTVLIVKARDAKKLSATTAKIEALLRRRMGGPSRSRRPGGSTPGIETLKSGKLKVHYVRIPSRDFMPLAPAWAVHEDKFYFALWPQVIIGAVQGAGRRPLAQDPAFRKLRGRVAVKASAMTFVNTPQIVRRLYNFILVGWTGISNSREATRNFPFVPQPDWLPALPQIEKYLQPEISAISSDAEGITIEGYGSTPLTGLATAPVAAPMAAAVLLPAVGRARNLAQQAVSMANLNAIGKAVAMYMAEYDDKVPPNLAKLVELRYITPQALVSPVSGRKMPTDSKGVPKGESDYVYIVMGPDADGELIRAYERPENHRNKGTCVLLVSGVVTWMDMPQFKALLRRTLAARKKSPNGDQF